MTKTLTEQWREGTLPAGCYYVLSTEDDTPVACDIDTVCDFMIRDVIAPVPGYEEYKQLVSKTEQLEKKLKIAMETLQKIADYQTDVLLQYWAEGALNKIKEMEGVK